MRIPVPTNRLVAFTLVGALLTAVVAGGLAFPNAVGSLSPTDELGRAPFEKLAGNGGSGAGESAQQGAATQAPEPNENFTPAVQTRVQSGGGGTPTAGDGSGTATAAPPTPNPNFTPSVQTQASSGYHEEEEYEEHEEEHEEYEEEHDEGEE